MSIPTKLTLLFITLFKLWLIMALPVIAFGGASHDDGLFVKLAGSILQAEWLGEYDQMTLSKGPFYPLWLALNFCLGLPLLVSQQAIYLAAGLIFVATLRPVFQREAPLVLLYALYAFNIEIITQVLRNGLYPALVVLVFAGLAGVHLRRDAESRVLAGWTALTGVALSAYWLTREEGLSLLPSVLLMLTWTLWRLFARHRLTAGFFRRGAICLLPLAILYAALQGTALLNKIHYDTYMVVELNSAPFTSAFGALSRVTPAQTKHYVAVPAGVREQIYRVSPAFRELQTDLEGPLKEKWDIPALCRVYPETCGDIPGGWFVWAFRDAVTRAGYYRSAGSANEFYERLAAAINGACDRDELVCSPPRKSLLPPYRGEYTPAVAKAFWGGVKFLTGFTSIPDSHQATVAKLDPDGQASFRQVIQDLGALFRPPRSTGSEEQLRRFRDITRSRLAPLANLDEEPLPAQHRLDAIKLQVLRAVATLYDWLTPVLAVAALAAYLIRFGQLFRHPIGFLFVLNTALLGAVLARLLLLAIIDATFFPAILPRYFSPLYPLLYLFIGLTLVDAFCPGQVGNDAPLGQSPPPASSRR